jgi:hypothetical protein
MVTMTIIKASIIVSTDMPTNPFWTIAMFAARHFDPGINGKGNIVDTSSMPVFIVLDY